MDIPIIALIITSLTCIAAWLNHVKKSPEQKGIDALHKANTSFEKGDYERAKYHYKNALISYTTKKEAEIGLGKCREALEKAKANSIQKNTNNTKKNVKTINHADGRYEGEVNDLGKMNGQGTYYTNNGNKYVGAFKDDKINGQGTYYHNNGNRYEGEWKDNKMNGQGTYYTNNSNKYEGKWKDNKMNGQGTYYWNDGHRYEGAWKDGKRNGQGTFYWNDGNRYVGAFKDDLFHGQGTKYYKSGKVESGEWYKGKFIGE